jgi:MFS family permease
MTTSLFARLPVAMANLAIILRVAGGTGSYARAGVVTAAYVVGTGVMGPVTGRLADRVGKRPVLLVAGVLNGAGLAAMALVPLGNVTVLLVVAAVAGATLPPVAPAVRSLWPALVGPELRSSVYAFDATMQEATFMIGPTLVALLSSAFGPRAALFGCAGIGIAGAIAVVSHPAMASPAGPASPAAPAAPGAPASPAAPAAPGSPSAPPAPASPAEGLAEPQRTPRTRRFLQPAGLPGLGSLVVIVLVFLASIVIVEVTVVAFAGHHGSRSQAGFLLTVWSTGSMFGGFVFGPRAAHAAERVLAALMAASAGGFLLLAAAPGVDVLYGLMFLAGVAIAPGFSAIYGLVGKLAPSEGAVEAFSWIASGIQMGAAGGAAIGGLLVQGVGTRWAFVFAAGCGLSTAGIAWWRARRLRPAPAPA